MSFTPYYPYFPLPITGLVCVLTKRKKRACWLKKRVELGQLMFSHNPDYTVQCTLSIQNPSSEVCPLLIQRAPDHEAGEASHC